MVTLVQMYFKQKKDQECNINEIYDLESKGRLLKHCVRIVMTHVTIFSHYITPFS